MDSNRDLTPSFSFLIPFRNREIERVENCIRSLANQNYKNFEVLFIDYGSDIEIAQNIENLVISYGFTYLYSDTRNMFWNQNQALNIGLMHTNNAYIIRLDVDIILPPSFLDVISKSVSSSNFINCRSYYASESFDYTSFTDESLSRLPVSDDTATGLCMIISRKNLLLINGFNEFYILWGYDDLDTTRSLKELGLEMKWMDIAQLPLLHQWHPKNNVALSVLIYETKKQYYLAKTRLISPIIGSKLVTTQRACFNIINNLNPSKKIQTNGYLESIRFDWLSKFDKLPSDDYIYFSYSNSFESNPSSRLGFIMDKINTLFKKLTISYRIVSLEQYETSFSYEQLDDFIILFVMNFRHLIKDYYYKKSNAETIFIVVKA